MNKIKLKPCPFCGGRAKIHECSNYTPFSETVTYFFVMCSKCYIHAFSSDTICNLRYKEDSEKIIEKLKQEIAEDWNRRAEINGNNEKVKHGK